MDALKEKIYFAQVKNGEIVSEEIKDFERFSQGREEKKTRSLALSYLPHFEGISGPGRWKDGKIYYSTEDVFKFKKRLRVKEWPSKSPERQREYQRKYYYKKKQTPFQKIQSLRQMDFAGIVKEIEKEDEWVLVTALTTKKTIPGIRIQTSKEEGIGIFRVTARIQNKTLDGLKKEGILWDAVRLDETPKRPDIKRTIMSPIQEEKRNLSVDVPLSLHKKIRIRAIEDDVEVEDIVESALLAFFR